MEPLDEKELSQILRRWEAPPAPPSLGRRIFPERQSSVRWWQWLLTGSIRIPVPVGVVVVLLLALWVYSSTSSHETVTTQPSRAVPMAEFQPVKQLEPRIIRGQ